MKYFALIMSALILLSSGVQANASVRARAELVKASSNMRSISIVFATQQTETDVGYDAEEFLTMKDFLKLMAAWDLTDSRVFFSHIEYPEFKNDTPPVIITPKQEGTPPEINSDILKFPIGYSIAVYPDPNEMPTSLTPLLWTRGLHKFQEFDKPYSGHIAFLDGHVNYFEGEPGNQDPDLIKVFEEGSPYSSAIRILEHVPDDWVETAPLPIRYREGARIPFFARYGALFFLFIPPLLSGFLAIIFKRTGTPFYQRVISGAKTFTIVLIFTVLLSSIFLC
ncbi:MAG: hypothetical protein ACSHX4_05775 [Opitutaceae bacterium]